jgi:hypothetical protein
MTPICGPSDAVPLPFLLTTERDQPLRCEAASRCYSHVNSGLLAAPRSSVQVKQEARSFDPKEPCFSFDRICNAQNSRSETKPKATQSWISRQ